ncbi:glycine betaine ABC transporter substrate-binding protein [Undibacterium sp. TJN25]|uniref:ABC transporter permease/substrate-binding protein n=1 Tax=Undibacterium sp. TJN25 TaxID=3413056 RepID=UPI003BF1F7FE
MADETLHVGSKRFTESYILGEILTQVAAPHAPVEHRQGLGNTAIVFEALKAGAIDLYPEYMGTIEQEILKHTRPATLETTQRELAAMGLGVAIKFGFNNTYALAMRDADSKRLGVRRIADLPVHRELKFGLSHEFLGRADGWPGLAQRYSLPQQAQGLDHGIAYEALRKSQIDVIDIYSTDAKIKQLGLQVLDDNAGYFPRYDAVVLYRLDAVQRFPAAWRALQGLQGRINENSMIAMNAAAELDGKGFSEVAHDYLKQQGSSVATEPARKNFWDILFGKDLGRLTRQHILLVASSVILAILAGIPLGVAAAYFRHLRYPVMAFVSITQTIPSLALLAILIPVLGRIGTVPALVALFLYALLPIVSNACIGMEQVPQGLRMAATALGMETRDRILQIELPLALPVILAGIRTAAVISVGTATIAAFIGAGGYGERIAVGLALNDYNMLLAGAIPSAALALLTQALFEGLEYLFFARLPGNKMSR